MATISKTLTTTKKHRIEYKHASNKIDELIKIITYSLELAEQAINIMAPSMDENIKYSLSFKLVNDSNEASLLPEYARDIHTPPTTLNMEDL